MKLYYSTTSPYSRKVRLFAREGGLDTQIEEIIVNPFADDKDALIKANPLGKIPTLVLDNGKALYDSPVICYYLDSLLDHSSLIPTPHYLDVLQWQALSDGLTDATYNIAIERRARPKEEQSPKWITNWSAEIKRTLESIESHIDDLNKLGSDITLAHLSLASAISYLELRLPEALSKAGKSEVGAYPHIMSWYESFKTRPSMLDTQLHDVTN